VPLKNQSTSAAYNLVFPISALNSVLLSMTSCSLQASEKIDGGCLAAPAFTCRPGYDQVGYDCWQSFGAWQITQLMMRSHDVVVQLATSRMAPSSMV
jgi:hypothetical protein